MTEKKKTGKARSKKQEEQKTEKKKPSGPSPYQVPHREYLTCPACNEKITWEPTKETEKGFIPCDPKLRIVVFNLPDNDLTKVPFEEQVRAIEIGTGRCVFGRCVNERERKYFEKHKTLDGLVPWCMARLSHFETCTRWDRWLSGEAKYPMTESGDSESTHAI